MTTPTLFQVFIGPLWLPVTNPSAWDYSRSNDFNLAGGTGTLKTDLTATATTIAIVSASDPPPQGGVWLSPSTPRANQSWEYVAYTNATNILDDNWQLAGVAREPAATRQHNGLHDAGDYVRFWVPLNANDGKLHIIEEMDPALASAAWIADLTGVLAPHGLLRTHHAVYIRTSSDHTTWTPFLLGWIDSFQIEDDYQRYAKWSLRITSIAGILNGQRCPTVRIGELDLARAGRIVKSATILAHPCKERNSDDYVEANPDLSGASLIDGKSDTLCIFERTLGGPARDFEEEAEMFGQDYFGQLNLSIPPGIGKGYRWVQIYRTGGNTKMWNSALCQSNGDQGTFVQINGNATTGSRIVVCENLNKFMTMFPLADPTRIKEIGPGWFDNLNLNPAEGETLGILADNGMTGFHWNGTQIAFGASPPAEARYTHIDAEGDDHHFDATARNVDCPSPTNGKIIAFNYTGANRNDYFKLVDWDTCAYTGDVAPWVLIQLPRMNLRLHADLPADGVGVIDISDGAALSTNGLDAWGTIQIGGEQLTYTDKMATTITLTARGVNGTTAAAHLAEDPVYILCDNQATDAYPLDRVTWWRPPGANAPKNFAVYLSNMLTLPRMPNHDDEDPSSNYRVDYNWAYGVENHTGNTWTWPLAGFNVRPSWLLMEISAMQIGPARPRVNTISAYLDTACWDDAEWLPVNTDIGAAYTHLLTQIGIPSGCIHDYTTNHDQFKLITGEKPAWPVLVDLADYTNTMVKVNLLSHIYLYDNGMWQTYYTGPGSLTNPIATYDRTTAKNVKLIQERPGPVGQVKLTWLNTAGEEAGTITYPNPADPSGLVQTLKPAIHASAAYALAALQRRYLVLKHPNTIGVELAVGNPALRTGVAYGIAWNFHDGSNASKIGYCQSIDHVFENCTWTTALRLIGFRNANY